MIIVCENVAIFQHAFVTVCDRDSNVCFTLLDTFKVIYNFDHSQHITLPIAQF